MIFVLLIFVQQFIISRSPISSVFLPSIKMELSNFSYILPNFESIDIAAQIAEQEEFQRLKLPSGKINRLPSGYYPYQELPRFLLSKGINRLIINFKTGVGKTCAMVSTADSFREGYQNSSQPIVNFDKENARANVFGELASFVNDYISVNKTTIRHVYIVTRKGLSDEVRRQIACKCTHNKYDPNQLGNYFTVETYDYFAKRNFIKSGDMLIEKSPSDIRTELENSLIVVDEVQYLYGDNEKYAPEIDPKREKKKKPDKYKKYKSTVRIFRILQDVKILIMSATLMPRKVGNILPIFNLISNRDNKIKESDLKYILNENIDYDDRMRHLFKFAGGKISFVRELDTNTQIKYIGEEVDLFPNRLSSDGKHHSPHLILDFSIMEPDGIQYKVYRDIVNNIKQTKNDPFVNKAITASNFVFPNGKYGKKEGYLANVLGEQPVKIQRARGRPTQGDKSVAQRMNPIPSFRTAFLGRTQEDTLRNIRKSGCKIAKIIEDTLNTAYTQENIEKNKRKGIDWLQAGLGQRFVYSYYVESGVLTIAALLTLFGYTEFVGDIDPFEQIDDISSSHNKLKCITDEKMFKLKTTGSGALKPAKRFCIMSSRNENFRNKVVELLNCKENMHGEYLQVVLGTSVVEAGYNYLNIIHIDIVEPATDFARMYQIQSRGVRADSQLFLVDKYADEIVARENKFFSDEEEFLEYKKKITDTININVNVHYHCAIAPDPDIKSQNLKQFASNEKREVNIKRLERMLKEIEVTCHINILHNASSSSIINKPYSKECDYQLCEYKCWGRDPNPKNHYTKTSEVLYSSKIIRNVIEIIIKKLKLRSQININELYKYFYDKHLIEKNIVAHAIVNLVENKMNITNDFGFKSYIQEDGINIFLSREYPKVGESGASNYLYETSLVVQEDIILKRLIEGMLGITDTSGGEILENGLEIFKVSFDKISKLEPIDIECLSPVIRKTLTVEEKYISDYLYSLPVLQQVKILEYAVQVAGSDDENIAEIAQLVIQYYLRIKQLFILEHRPTSFINDLQMIMSTRKNKTNNKSLGGLIDLIIKMNKRNEEINYQAGKNNKLIYKFQGTDFEIPFDEDEPEVWFHVLNTRKDKADKKSMIRNVNTQMDKEIRIFNPQVNNWRNAKKPQEFLAYNAVVLQKYQEALKPYLLYPYYCVYIEQYRSTRLIDNRPQHDESGNLVTQMDKNSKDRNKGKDPCSSGGMDLKTVRYPLMWYMAIIPQGLYDDKISNKKIDLLLKTWKIFVTDEYYKDTKYNREIYAKYKDVNGDTYEQFRNRFVYTWVIKKLNGERLGMEMIKFFRQKGLTLYY